jgi:hypothetical protein
MLALGLGKDPLPISDNSMSAIDLAKNPGSHEKFKSILGYRNFR